VDMDAASAMESARLRLAAAERWHASSVAMLQQAKAQADLSGKEAEAARAALHELELRSACPPTGSDSSAPNQAAHIGDVDATALSSGKDDGLLHGGVGQNPSGQEVYNVPAVVSAPDEGDRKPAVVVTASVGEADGRKPAAVVTPGDERRDDDEARKPKAVSPTASVVSDSHSVYVSARSNINSITISDSSIEEVNGKYVKLEKLDGVWSYSKIANWGGKETMFTVLRTNASGSGSRKWYITVNDRGVETAFYVALAPNFVLHPPRKNWMAVVGDGQGGEEEEYPPAEMGLATAGSQRSLREGEHSLPVIAHEVVPERKASRRELAGSGSASQRGLVPRSIIGSEPMRRSASRRKSRSRSVSTTRQNPSTRNRSVSRSRFEIRIAGHED